MKGFPYIVLDNLIVVVVLSYCRQIRFLPLDNYLPTKVIFISQKQFILPEKVIFYRNFQLFFLSLLSPRKRPNGFLVYERISFALTDVCFSTVRKKKRYYIYFDRNGSIDLYLT